VIGGASDADADGFFDGPGGMAGFAQPKRPGSAQVEAIVTAVNFKSSREAPGAAGEVEKSRRLAMALHDFDALKRFNRADENRGGGFGWFAYYIEHEVRAIVEENISVAGGEIHRTYAWGWSAEVMPGRIAGWVGFRLHDAAAEAARAEIMDDDFSDEEARESDGVRRKFRAAEAANSEFFR
jgi:hypothetical protein